MTPIDRFERQLPSALTDLADPRTPDYLVDILGLTARSRQRPAWASLERWLPMDIASTTRPVRGAPWRQLGVLALLAVLLATAVAVYVGSRRSEPPSLPAPFGRAANGLIPYAVDGDILGGDPATGGSVPLLTGPEYDYDPGYSRDGTRIAFWQRADSAVVDGPERLMVMDADGADPQPVATEPLQNIEWWDWSPMGDALLVLHQSRGTQELQLFDPDGATAPRTLAEGITVVGPSFRPPDGAEILFRGQTAEGIRLYVMKADGTDIRPLTAPITGSPEYDLRKPRYSPDGSQIAYNTWDAAQGAMRVYVMDADGANLRQVEGDAGTFFLAWPVWSNDGTRIVAERGHDKPDGEYELTYVVIDLEDGSVTPTGPALPEKGGTIEWAPDDSRLLMRPNEDGAQQLLLDPNGGPWTEAPWDSDSYPNWQRLAN